MQATHHNREKVIAPRHDGAPAGFTLVEMLVSISILLLVIIGPMTIAAKGMQSGYFANEQTTAVFLAQEALESIRKVRDDKALQVMKAGSGDTADWYGDLESACKSPRTCDIDINGEGYKDCAKIGNCNLEMDANPNPNATIVYGYGDIGWVPTPYTRTITVDDHGADGWSVTVTVTWESRLFSNYKTVTLQTWLYNQYDIN